MPKRSFNNKISALCGLIFTAFIVSCAGSDPQRPFDARHNDYIDYDAQLARDDYRGLTPRTRDQAAPLGAPQQHNEPPIPQASDILFAPKPAPLVNDKRISLSVTEEVPVRDMLIELARLADVDL